MTEAPLARHLVRFPRRPPAGASVVPPAPCPESIPVEPTVTITEKAFAAELERACDAVREELEARHAAAMTALRVDGVAAIEAAIATQKATLLESLGGGVAGQVEVAFAGLHETLASEVAAALRPLLSEAVVQRTTTVLLEAIRAALADPDRPVLMVCGPAEILASIATGLGGRAGVEFETQNTSEVVVTANGARIETRLVAALASLAKLEEA